MHACAVVHASVVLPVKDNYVNELDGSDEFFLCVDESKVICSLSNNRHVAFAILSMLNRVTAALYFTETILNPYTYKFIYMYQLVFSSRHYNLVYIMVLCLFFY